MLLFVFALLLMACGEESKPVVVETIRPVKFGEIIMSGDALVETFSGSAQSSKESKVSFKMVNPQHSEYFTVDYIIFLLMRVLKF